MISQRNNLQICVLRDVVSAGQLGTTTIDELTDLADGTMAVVDADGTVQSGAGNTNTAYRFVYRNGNNLIYSNFFTGNDVVTSSYKDAVAATEQITYIGSDGTNGSIEAINDNSYRGVLNLIWEDKAGNNPSQSHNIVNYMYESDSSATQYEIANGLAASMVANIDKPLAKWLRVDVVNSAAATAANCFDNDATVVKGTNTIVVGTNLQYNTGAGTAVVGDFVRLQGPTASGTTVTDPVYRITAINSLTLTLDRAVTCASGTYAAGDDELEVIDSATGLAANFGVKVSGLQPTTFDAKIDKYQRIRFLVGLTNFGTTDLDYSQSAYKGQGFWKEIAELEYFTEFPEGNCYGADYLRTQRTSVAQALSGTSTTYDGIYLQFLDTTQLSGMGASGYSPFEIMIFAPAAGTNDQAADVVLDLAGIIAF